MVTRAAEDSLHRSLHGLTRTLISQHGTGVTEGFTRNLEIAGVGYRVAKEGKALVFALGFSHPVRIDPPTGIILQRRNPHTLQRTGHRQAGRRPAGARDSASCASPSPTRAKASLPGRAHPPQGRQGR